MAFNLRVTRLTSTIGIYTSIAYLVIGLVLARLGYAYTLHPAMMVFGALTVFVAAIAIVYTASTRPRSPLYLGFLVGGAVLAYTTPLLWLYSTDYGTVASSFALAVIGLGILDAGSRVRGGTTRWSLLTLAYTFIYSSIYLAVTSTIPIDGLFRILLGYILAYPIQAIYSVTLHALPSTYHSKPSKTVFLAFPLASLASVLLPMKPLIGAILAISSFSIFVATTGFTRIPLMIKRLPSTEAGRAHRYFLIGHIYALVSILIASIILAFYGLGIIPLLYLVHYLLIGVVTVFIAIHAPLMVPVILSTRTARRYNQTPFAVLVSSGILWLLSRDLALVLFITGLALVILVVKPIRKTR